MFRSFLLAFVSCGLTACSVGHPPAALQPEADGAQALLEAGEADLKGLEVLSLMSRGAEALAIGDAEQAVLLLDQAMQVGGEEPTTLFLRGVAHLEVGNLGLAVRDLERMLELKPDDVAAYCALARAHRAAGDVEASIEAVAHAVELEPEDARLLTLQGHLLLESGRVDQAYDSLLEAARLDPGNLETQRALGILFTESGDASNAELAWRHALELAPDDVLLHAGLANTLRDLGRDEEALESCLRAASLDPENPVHLANLGSTYFRLSRFREARDAYERALALDALPPRPLSFVALNHGVVLERLGDELGAMMAFERALEADPDRAEAHESLGLLLLDRAEDAAALEHLGAALDLDLISPEAVLELALVAERLGVPERARQCAALLDAWEESDAIVAFRRAQLLVRCQDIEVHDAEAAITILEELLAGPLGDSAAVWNMLAEALVGEARFDEALNATERALELVEPGAPSWHRSRDLRAQCLTSLVGT